MGTLNPAHSLTHLLGDICSTNFVDFSVFIFISGTFYVQFYEYEYIPSVLSHCWLGDRKGIWPVKKTGCWFVGGDDLTGALHVISPVVTTTSVILSSNKI